METIVLASASPRRQDYFRLLGLPFIIKPSLIEETYDESLPLEKIPETIATRKVMSVAESLRKGDAEGSVEKPGWIFGADTIVAIDGRIFGKPKDRAEAKRTLVYLQNRTHLVISGIVLYRMKDSRLASKTVISEVSFASLSSAELEWYLDTGEWEGVAGAYKAQGIANCFIFGIKGSFSNVVGLPLREFYELLTENGYKYGAGDHS
jgi:septum formation protein